MPSERGGGALSHLSSCDVAPPPARLQPSRYPRGRYGNVTTAEFIETAERVSGQQLDEFFRVWLYAPVKPTTW